MIALPDPRGAVTELLLHALPGAVAPLPVAEPTSDEDLQLALYLCYELHYRGLPGVDDRVGVGAVAARACARALERRFEAQLRRDGRRGDAGRRARSTLALRAIERADDGPSLSSYLEREATLEQFLEFVVHRSAYQLKEADPHSWAIPRLTGARRRR